MQKDTWKKCSEGIIVLLLGIICLFTALLVRNNPVPMDIGWVNFLAQARFFPLVAGVGITLLGINLILQQFQGKIEAIKMEKSEVIRIAILLVATLIYVLLILNIGFKIATFTYLIAIMFYLNKGIYKPSFIMAMSILFAVVGVWILPMLVNIPLP